MIIPSCNDDSVRLAVIGGRDVLTLVEVRVHSALTLPPVLRMFDSSTTSKLRTTRASRAYILPTLSKDRKDAPSDLIRWNDVIHPLGTQYAPPYWELVHATRIYASQVAFKLSRHVLLSIIGIVTPQLVTHALIEVVRNSSLAPPKQVTLDIPRIIITMPDDSPAFCDVVPTPQNAAFGNQLTVPDPQLQVVNCQCHEDSLSGRFRGNEPVDGSGVCDSGGSVEYSPWKEEDEEDELDLASTWSG
ncbi:hypothetical protein K439DRAFT_1611150 [Ramaria rubella]|nr:hypothetical protein K439DRAFT_1611150 [Ramaria rubella]